MFDTIRMIQSILKQSGTKKVKKSIRMSSTNRMRIINPHFLHYITPAQRKEFSTHDVPYRDIVSPLRRQTRKQKHHIG